MYAIPSVTSQLISSIYNIVDRVFLGQNVGALALAGLAITLPVMNIVHAFGSLVGVGSSARISIVLGRKDINWAEKILGNSMLLTFFFGFLFLVGGYAFLDPILQLFGASADTLQFARQYMVIVLPGMFMTTLTYNLAGLIRATGYPNKSMWILAGGAVLNIILDALFISVFGWGIAGAAWATTISMTVSGLAAVWHFLPVNRLHRKEAFIRFKRHCWQPKFYIFRNILAIGVSPFLMNFAASAVVILLNRQLIRFGGDLAVGAYGVVNSFASIVIMFFLGVCQGMQPIAGYNYGAGHTERLKETYSLTRNVCMMLGLCGAVLSFAFPRLIISCFTNDESLIAIGIPALRYLMVMTPFIGFTITNSQFFMSIDKPWISIVTSMSRQVIFLIPAIFAVPAIVTSLGGNGLTGVWLSCTTSDLFGAFLAYVLFLTQRKVFRPGYVPPERRPRKEAGPR